MTEALVAGELMTASTDSASPGRGPRLAPLHAEALKIDPDGTGERFLQPADETGRQGIAQGVSLLELSRMHHVALAKALMRISRSARIQEEVRRAGASFAESLSPYEMAQRGFRDAVCALRQLNETMEGEIKRIAHSVHDEAGQLLDGARLAISGVDHEASPLLRNRLREVAAILDQAEAELRRLSHELRPLILDDLGLVPALQVLAEGTARRSGVTVRFETSLEGRAPAKVETALYRIVQEALTNVVRHARAKSVRIQLGRDCNGTLRCTFRDDGVGFDVVSVLSRKDRGGLGLVGIRERLNAVGGTLELHSDAGWGTELRIEVPAEK